MGDVRRGNWVVLVVLAACEARHEATVALSAAESGPTYLYEETFGRLEPTLVPVAGGSWAASDLVLRLRSPARGYPNGNILLTNHEVFGDFTVTGSAQPLQDAGWNDFSVVFGYRDASDYWFASFNEANDGETNGLFHWKNGALTEVADFAAVGTRAGFRIERVGSHVTVTRDQVLAASVDLPELGDGRIGLGSRNDAVDFFEPFLVSVPGHLPQNFWIDDFGLAAFAGGATSGFVPIAFHAPLAQSVEAPPVTGPLDNVALYRGYVELDSVVHPDGPLAYQLRAHDGNGQTASAPATSITVANSCTRVAPGQSFSQAIGPFTRPFTMRWQGVAGAAPMDGGFALGRGPARYFSQGAAIVRFAPSGFFDARNGDVYAAATQIAYEPGVGYEFSLDVDPSRHSYTAGVRRANQDAPFVAWAYTFRSTQLVDTIDTISVIADPASPAPVTFCNPRAF